ncbi:MAG: indolepyruvate oxidoreductase subunit beta [Oscillospiraceae bacterium]|jgi:indolepyruvate ferredoxin oxidoreductase beta subunit|nr:indolepyruvate oxidoreductase subunit beta [Oscillospiraceae bacterium]
MKMDIIIVGVGGQGILLASRVLGRLAMDAGQDVKVSEVHGMSQRGGDVITHVRIGQAVQSPLIEEGTADAIIAFEQMEAVRALPYLKKGGVVITNTQKIAPMPVLSGTAKYPEGLLETLRSVGGLFAFDALCVARACGAQRAVNIVLLGAYAQKQAGDKEAWLKAVAACVPQKTTEANRRAFEAGWHAAKEDETHGQERNETPDLG